MVSEAMFKLELKEKLEKLFPGCIVLNTDPSFLQGFPDLLILYRDKWALLECKNSIRASFQPNQVYWIDRAREWAYSNFVYPENVNEVLDDLQQSFRCNG